MMRTNPCPGEFWRHFKNVVYKIICVGHHSETGEKLVVYVRCRKERRDKAVMDLDRLVGFKRTYTYVAEDMEPCIRPLEMFMSEVDRVKYPDAPQHFRFEKVEDL